MKKNLISLLRNLEYEEIAKLTINGKILDIGGSKKSGYHDLIRGKHEIVTANINEKYGIDVIFDAEKNFPLADSSFNAVIMMNVLEHLFGYKNAVSESYRVLKNGGLLVGSVPFMINVHGSPDDYFRYTRSALDRIFKEAGFKEVEINELGSGSFSVAYHLGLGLYRIRIISYLFMKLAIVCDWVFSTIKPENLMSKKYMPLGYSFVAKK